MSLLHFGRPDSRRADGAASRWAAAVLLATALACSTAPGSPAAPPVRAHTEGVLVVLLGTGTPNAEPDRAGSALAVVVGDRSYLVDCGPGVVRRANGASLSRGIEALDPPNLRRVFITHLHSDHTLGLPDLVFTPWTLGREVPLEVYGPPGVAEMAEHIASAWRSDVEIRLGGAEPANSDGWRIAAREVEPGEIYQDDLVTIEPFAVRHGSFEHAYGYRITTPEGVVVVSGDTGPFDGMVDIARGAALLVHEVYATAGWRRREPLWQRYHTSFHTSGREVGELARRAGVGAVVLTHQLLWGAPEDEVVEEVRAAYPGPVFYGRDLDVLRLASDRVTLQPPAR